MEDLSTKSVRVPTLTKSKDVSLWLMRFMAFAVVVGVEKSVQTTPHPDLPARENARLKPGTDDEAIKALKENQRAFAYLTMAMASDKFIGLLNQAKTREFPSGLAWKFMEKFQQKYRPDDRVSGIEVQQHWML